LNLLGFSKGKFTGAMSTPRKETKIDPYYVTLHIPGLGVVGDDYLQKHFERILNREEDIVINGLMKR
jgi:hypothetical protein